MDNTQLIADIQTIFERNRTLPDLMLQRLKDRKAKIRKFMLYVNGMLNDTEKDMQALCQLILDIHVLVPEPMQEPKMVSRLHSMSRRRVKRTKPTPTCPRAEDVVVPETVPCNSRDIQDTQLNTVVQETLTTKSSNKPEPSDMEGSEDIATEPKGQIRVDSPVEGSIEDDETIGIPLDESLPSYPRIDANRNQFVDGAKSCRDAPESKGASASVTTSEELPIKSPTLSNSDEETYFLTPVTSLVNHVLGSAKPPHGIRDNVYLTEDNRMASFSHKRLGKRVTSKNSPMKTGLAKNTGSATGYTNLESNKGNAEDLTVSPALFADSEDNGEIEGKGVEPVGNGRKAQVVSHCVSSDKLERTNDKPAKKTVTCWPKPKPVTRGELVVEPASKGRTRKRPRQTRLDGFLAKAAFYNSMESSSSEPLIVMNTVGSSHSGSLSKPVTLDASSSSESDDALDTDLALLRPPTAAGSSLEKTSSGVNTVEDECPEYDKVPQKTKYEVGQVVRGKARKHLTGYRCKQCYEYYRALNLSEEQIQQRLNMICRHRAVKPPMETPPSFWNMSIASLDPHQE